MTQKLSLDEAFKRAEPGPAKAYPDDAETYCCVVFPETGQAFIVDHAGPRADVTACLQAHCFNNFAEAVALLKQARERVGYTDDDPDGQLRSSINEALQRFETVEVP